MGSWSSGWEPCSRRARCGPTYDKMSWQLWDNCYLDKTFLGGIGRSGWGWDGLWGIDTLKDGLEHSWDMEWLLLGKRESRALIWFDFWQRIHGNACKPSSSRKGMQMAGGRKGIIVKAKSLLSQRIHSKNRNWVFVMSRDKCRIKRCNSSKPWHCLLIACGSLWLEARLLGGRNYDHLGIGRRMGV